MASEKSAVSARATPPLSTAQARSSSDDERGVKAVISLITSHRKKRRANEPTQTPVSPYWQRKPPVSRLPALVASRIVGREPAALSGHARPPRALAHRRRARHDARGGTTGRRGQGARLRRRGEPGAAAAQAVHPAGVPGRGPAGRWRGGGPAARASYRQRLQRQGGSRRRRSRPGDL